MQCFNMFHLFAFCILLSSAVASANNQDAGNTQQQTLSSKGRPCNINNYNSFYAGTNKKVESLLLDIKRQLVDLQRQVTLLTKENSTNSKGRYFRMEINIIIRIFTLYVIINASQSSWKIDLPVFPVSIL